MSRRNLLIRRVVAVTDDLPVGVALAAACSLVILAAVLGTFLTVMTWLVTTLATLAVS